MNQFDLYGLRQHFQTQRILLCFNGPISRSLIEEIGNALKNYMEAERIEADAVTDVFAIYIEMTQNIRHYATRQGYGETDAAATVVIGTDESGRYVIEAGNRVEPADGEVLTAQVRELAAMDAAELKAAYKKQLRAPRDEAGASGAGLGLIDMARRASAPLVAELKNDEGGQAFFSLRAVVGPRGDD
ncbi:biofilm regulation protein kinase SiaB [Thioalkalivibrio sp. ALE11]|uniref:biofilm regulation protein kinase SiaB n=1 Tax=Thioalkalivibrio sp. ALE11 TaxID=1265494 RepID=UPI00036C915A|nr:biofilm regulation protein kinase SiaB [Thioalkalivibrio sp. ALE11]